MTVISAGRRWVTVFFAVVATTVLGAGSASTAPPAPAPISPQLAAQIAENPDGRFRVMVHGTDLAAADRAVANTGMTKHTEYRQVAVVVATAAAEQIQAARVQQGVTYLEGDQPLDYHNRPM